jgi:hypothetical protein
MAATTNLIIAFIARMRSLHEMDSHQLLLSMEQTFRIIKLALADRFLKNMDEIRPLSRGRETPLFPHRLCEVHRGRFTEDAIL